MHHIDFCNLDYYGRRHSGFGRPLLGMYTSDAKVIELGMGRLRIMMAAYFLCGVMNVFPGLTRAMGYSMLPMLSD